MIGVQCRNGISRPAPYYIANIQYRHSPMTDHNLLTLDNPHLDAIMLHRAADKLSTGIDDETVILDMASSNYIGLNPVATRIWELIEPGISFAGLCERLIAEYDVSENSCRADTLSFLQEMLENQLIDAQPAEIPSSNTCGQ